MVDSDVMLSIGEAAKLMGVCENTLRDWDIEGKFIAERTNGNHRRYSLNNIRKWVDENVKNEPKKECYLKQVQLDLIEKWKEYLGEEKDVNLAILLENQKLTQEFMQENIFSTNQLLWLVKESWARIQFKKMVSVVSFLHPCELVPYIKEQNNNFVLETKATAIPSFKYNFSIFNNANFDNVKELYADAIAKDIDLMILDKLPKTTTDNIDIILHREEQFPACQYVIGPKVVIDNIKKSIKNENIDYYEIQTILDKETFIPFCCVGNYAKNNLTLPIFCPYVLINVCPTTTLSVRNLIGRCGWVEL